jgi:hypothetical protein
MTTDTNTPRQDHREKKVRYTGPASAPVYGLGLIGALVYYLQHATTLLAGVVGFFKAIFWPAMLVYKLLEFLKM